MSARDRTPFGNFELRRSHLKTGPNPHTPGSADRVGFDLVHTDGVPSIDEQLRDAARRTVAGNAIDLDDARDLLGALGLEAS